MTNAKIANLKVAVAEEACTKIQAAWYVAHKALEGGAVTNGYGIYRDRTEFLDKLELAQQKIGEAIKTLEAVNWPTPADYDLI